MLFQLIDVDYIFNGSKPVIRMFGKTENGNNICVFYDKLMPYFYIKPKNEEDAEKIKEIKEVLTTSWEKKFIPTGYYSQPEKLLKITLFNPQNVPSIRDKLMVEGIASEVYESDILFKYRFMVDNDFFGMQWIEAECTRVQASNIKIPTYYAAQLKPVEHENIPLKIMAIDIESMSIDKKKQPEPKNSVITMISIAFNTPYNGKKDIVITSKLINTTTAHSFRSEKEMLEEFVKITDAYDPDIITGYNMNAFDIPYILERMRKNNIPCYLGRCNDKQTYNKTFGLSQETIIPGRIAFDPYQILRRDPWLKLSRYDLNTVSKQLLNEEKHHVAYSEMEDLWNGTQEEMERFIEYSRKDAKLALDLVIKRNMLDKFFEISKISGSLLQDTFGGQSSRIEVMILHEFKKKDFVMPSKPSNVVMSKRTRDKQDLKGATVLEPKKGLHTDGCVLVLDFKSLYPSIMRTYNISPDTLVVNDKESTKSHESPLGVRFVDDDIRKGIFPDILRKLLEARSAAKKQMAKAPGETKRMLNAKQLALKDISNSFYGYTGYARARLYMLDVANAITAYGRKNIEYTRKIVEDKFGFEVVYGDTDSIFVKTNITDLDKARDLGQQISKFVTENLPGYLELEFEKIYRTFLVLTKKRYVGWSFRYDDGWKDVIEMRGIETVRRDWCPIVSEIMMEIINIIMKEGDTKKAIDKVKKVIEDLRSNKVPLEKLTIIKSITKNVDSYDGTLPHIELAKKIKSRNPAEEPKVGDRLGFVIIRGNQLISKRAEDPEYARKNKLDIDSDYYIESQILPPIERILAASDVTRSELFGFGRQVGLADIINGNNKREKKEIKIDYKKPEKLDSWEEFVCKKCKKTYKRMPLRGSCECGGELSIGNHGSTGEKVTIN